MEVQPDSETALQLRDHATTLDRPKALTARWAQKGAVGSEGSAPVTMLDRMLIAGISRIARSFVARIDGLEHIAPGLDPFILVANHGSRREVLFLPPLLFEARHGKRIHFVADWNSQMIPGVGYLYRRAGVITTTRKSARPRFLNALKPLYAQPGTVLERARQHVVSGRSVALFPEGTINRDPHRLLTGRRGAAQLSLETGVPIVPLGIRHGDAGDASRAGGGGSMAIRIGAPLRPGDMGCVSGDPAGTRHWHEVVMREIERLSGKAWNPQRGDQR